MKLRSFVVAAVGLAMLAGLTACAQDPPPTPPPPPQPVCYNSWIDSAVPPLVPGAIPDLLYVGPIDTLGNARSYTSTDGTCTGAIQIEDVTVVSASDSSGASGKCGALGAGNYAGSSGPLNLGSLFNGPSDWWGC